MQSFVLLNIAHYCSSNIAQCDVTHKCKHYTCEGNSKSFYECIFSLNRHIFKDYVFAVVDAAETCY